MDMFSRSLRPAKKARIYAFLRPLIGHKLLDQLRLNRNFYFYRKAGIIFIHIPKAAGSSISHSLYGRSLGHFSGRELLAFQPTTFAGLYSFSVVRHPVDRLRSAYNYIRSNGTEFGSIAPDKEYLADDFQTFDLFVKSWLPRQDPNRLDPVLRPQAQFVCDGDGELLVKEIFKLESLADNWSTILSRGRSYQKTLGRHNVNADRFCEILGDDHELIGLISKTYGQDMDLWKSAI